VAELVPALRKRTLLARLSFEVNWAQIGLLLLLAGFGFYVLYPLLLILINSFDTARIGQQPVYGVESWLDAWRSPGIWAALWNSIVVAFWYQLISFPLGALIAWLLARTNFPWARGVEFLFWLSFFLPALSFTLGWMLLLDPKVGVINQLLAQLFHLDQGPFNIFSLPGIVWVHVMSHAVSTKVMLLTPAFRNMDVALEEAGGMSGANTWTTFRRVTLPLMTPALIIVFLLGIVRLFENFEIELLLGVPFGFYVFSTKVLDLVRQDPPLVSQASALGSVTLLLLVLAVPLQRWLTTRRQYVTVSSRMKPGLIDLGVWRWPVFGCVLLLGATLVAVPVLSSLAASLMTRFGFFEIPRPWTLRHWQLVLSDSGFLRALLNTAVIAILSGVVSAVLFSLVAYVIVRGKRLRGATTLDALMWVPSVIPGTLAGLGLLWMFLGTPLFNPLYGTVFLLIIAIMLGGVTLSTQLFKAGLLNLSREFEEASRMSGASAVRTYFRVVLPLLGPVLIVVATLRFLFAANETASIILLSTSETRTISLLTIDYVFQGLREPAAVTSVIVAALTTAAALMARRFGFRGIAAA